MRKTLFPASFFAAMLGCSSSDKPWPDLHPTQGTVKIGGQTPSGGYLTLTGQDPELADFIVGGRIETDGSFKLATTHSREKNSASKAGAPAGKYSARLMPAGGGDQVTGASFTPLESTKPVIVAVGENKLEIEFSKPKK